MTLNSPYDPLPNQLKNLVALVAVVFKILLQVPVVVVVLVLQIKLLYACLTHVLR